MSREDEHYLDSLPRCRNCGEDIRDHMADSEPPWRCPWGPWDEPHYGFFNGGDPRLFFPDSDSSAEEIARHKAACAEAERLEKARHLPCPSGWERRPDGTVAHVLRAPFGIGIYTQPPMCYENGAFEPAEGQKELPIWS